MWSPFLCEQAIYFIGPGVGNTKAVFFFSTCGKRTCEVGIASGRFDVFGNIVGVQKVQGKARAFSICGICKCAMCNTKVEEDRTSGWQFDRDGSFFGYCAVDVMVAVGVSTMVVDFAVAAGYDVQGTVGDVGIVKGNPHANAFGGSLILKMRSLVPKPCNALMPGLRRSGEVEHEGASR